MTFAEFRAGMNEFWDTANRRATELKDPIHTLERVAGMYRRLDSVDHDYANRVFDEWLLSHDEAKRYVSVALIREFGIETARPALQELINMLRASDDPGAPFEREKVEGVLTKLGAEGSTSI